MRKTQRKIDEMKTVEKLIQFALYRGILKDVKGRIKKPYDFNLDAAIASKEEIEFSLKEKNGVSNHKVSFANENDAYKGFIKALKKELPIVEVIDLISFAINSKIRNNSDQGIINDLTEENGFVTYENDYIALTTSNAVFEFEFSDDVNYNNTYSVTFNMGVANKLKNVDYASRHSRFIDILIKKIMSTYNILIVRNAYYTKNKGELSKPAVMKGYKLGDEKDFKQEALLKETSTLQGRMKVLIRYRDTVKNQTFSENVIDDIGIVFKGDGKPEFDSTEIEPGECDTIYGELNIIDDDEIENVTRIKNFMDDRNNKIEVFNYLRNNDSNLKKLIDSRSKIYAQSECIPRVEYTLTPLTIYSNHIAVKTVKYPIMSERQDEFFKGVICEYENEFDPTKMDKDFAYTFKFVDEDGNKITHVIDEKDNPLVMAVTYFNKKEKRIEAVAGCVKSTVKLYDENKEYYGEDIYKDVYFDKSKVVRYGQKNSKLASLYEKSGPFLNSDLLECSLTGKKYWPKDVAKTIAYKAVVPDKDGYNGYRWLDDSERKILVAKEHGHICEYCGKYVFAVGEIWQRYINDHRLYNSDKAKHCCHDCARKQEKGEIILHDPRGFYFATNKELDSVMHCPVCKMENTEKFLYNKKADDIKDDLNVCSVCGQLCCRSHLTEITGKSSVTEKNKKYVCNLCNGAVNMPKIKKKSFDDRDNKKLWRKVKQFLKAVDRRKKKTTFVENGKELYVYCNHTNYIRVYYFWKDAKNKNLFMKKKQKIREQ